jgi:hypothetical protein
VPSATSQLSKALVISCLSCDGSWVRLSPE